ncbi:MAG: serine/threonine-protein kinase, partial [Desulfobulbaceae bacterium]
GGIEYECFRSPKKEARILDLVAGHNNFMHGYSIQDEEGNLVRVLDFIQGKSLHSHVESMDLDHQTYFFNHFPDILKHFIECIAAVGFLHQHGEKHGDIRRDHILFDRETGDYRWIDFDYDYYHVANMFGYDLYGLGNILVFLVGGGDITVQQLQAEGSPHLEKLTQEDMNIIFNNRVANIQKIYPYIPDALNYILLHFSNGANLYYENTIQLLEDLGEVHINA